MSGDYNKIKVLLIIIIVPILAYISWLFYLKINTETIFDIVNEVVENKEIEKIEVSLMYSSDIKFSIEDKAEIDKILNIMKNVEVVNTEYQITYEGERLYNNLIFCCGATKIIVDNYDYPNIYISTLNANSSLLAINSYFQVINFEAKDIENLEDILKKYN